MDDWIYVIHSGSTAETRNPTYSQTKAAGVCPLNAKLEFFNDATNTWDDNSAWANSAFDTATGAFTVLYTTPPTKPFVEYFVKITIVDSQSVTSIATLEWTFTLQLRDQCADDTITLDAQISPFPYVISSGNSATKTPTITHLYTACAIQYDLYYFDDSEDIWIKDNTATTLDFTTFSTTTGDLVVNTADPKYSIQTIFSLKIVVTIPDSISSADLIEVEDRFKVTIKDACADNTL